MATYRLLSTSGSYGPYVGTDAPSGSFYRSYVVGKQDPIVGNLNVRRINDRGLYNRLLLGTAHMSEVGESGLPGTDPTSQLATVPSWTQKHIGFDHAFHLPAFSASMHEVSALNCYFSGNTALETTAVPASGALFYEKNLRFQTKVYKVVGSSALVSNVVPSVSYPTPFTASWVPASGVFLPCSNQSAANFGKSTGWLVPIPVSDNGYIRDIKVWVELVQDGNANSQTGSALGTLTFGNLSCRNHGLASLRIALQSPAYATAPPFFGVPAWNDPTYDGFFDILQLGSAESSGREKNPVPGNIMAPFLRNFYANSHVLWDGPIAGWGTSFINNIAGATSNGIAYPAIDVATPMWDRDRNIRTIFTDSSKNLNPRHVDPIYVGLSQSLPESFLSGGAPCVAGGAVTGTYHGFGFDLAWGSQFPWFADLTVGGLNIPTNTGSVPSGWLTGLTGAAAANEWSTQGMSLGPNDIRPVYPLLNDVYEMAYPATGSVTGSATYIGMRPGLYGTQMSGTWYLNVAEVCSAVTSSNAIFGLYFRQARLEITYDSSMGPKFPYPSKSLRFKKKTPRRARNYQIGITRDVGFRSQPVQATGIPYSVTLGHNLCPMSFEVQEQYGRSFGITDDTGSLSDFAVFTRMTGALADMLFASASLSVSGTAGALYSYLHNPFGTPFIPISSGSSIAPSFQAFNTQDLPTKSIISDILRPRPDFPQAHTLRATMSRLGGAQKTSDLVVERLLQLQQDSLL